MSKLKFKIVSAFFKVRSTLRHEFGKETTRQILHKTQYLYTELDNRKPKAEGVMRLHRTMWILGLALYRAMQDKLGDRDDLVDVVQRVLWKSVLCDLTRVQAFFVRRSKDPYSLYLRLLGPRNEEFFPCPPWKKREVELDNGVGWDQLNCPVYEFFKEEDELGLARAYCDLDKLIAQLVPNHIELRRQHTLATGASSCDFYYYKK